MTTSEYLKAERKSLMIETSSLAKRLGLDINQFYAKENHGKFNEREIEIIETYFKEKRREISK